MDDVDCVLMSPQLSSSTYVSWYYIVRSMHASLYELQVMEALKALTQSGHTVIASIHQPRSRIFDLFDDLLLLSSGSLLYSGPAQAALAHFEALGHTCPPHHNPAEFLADIISIDNSSDEAAEATRARFGELLAGATGSTKPKLAAKAASGQGTGGAAASSGAPLLRQIRMLFQRSWRQVNSLPSSALYLCAASLCS